jgi:hypothetical protein
VQVLLKEVVKLAPVQTKEAAAMSKVLVLLEKASVLLHELEGPLKGENESSEQDQIISPVWCAKIASSLRTKSSLNCTNFPRLFMTSFEPTSGGLYGYFWCS